MTIELHLTKYLQSRVVNATRLLRKAAATAIANLETVTVAKNETNNRRQLLISLKLWALVLKAVAAGSREVLRDYN